MSGIFTHMRRLFWPLLLAIALTACGPSGDSGPIVPNSSDGGDMVIENVRDDPAEEAGPAAVIDTGAFLEAVGQRLIEYQVAGLDASSGDSLRLRVRRLTPRPLTLRIAPGTVFAPGSSGVQRMAALSVSGEVTSPGSNSMQPGDSIQLADDEWHEFIVNAFCLDFELENPSPQNSFEVRTVDARAATILTAANNQGLGIEATQAAIWLDRGVTGDRIREQFSVTTEDLARAEQLLAGLPS